MTVRTIESMTARGARELIAQYQQDNPDLEFATIAAESVIGYRRPGDRWYICAMWAITGCWVVDTRWPLINGREPVDQSEFLLVERTDDEQRTI